MFKDETQRQELLDLLNLADERGGDPVCGNYPDAFFPENGDSFSLMLTAAKALCAACPIMVECAEFGIKWEERGIWGGLTTYDRRRIKSAGSSLAGRYRTQEPSREVA